MKILLFSILQLSFLNLFFLHAQQKDPVYLKTFQEIDGFVALWDFKEEKGKERYANNGKEYPLKDPLGSVERVNEGPLSGFSAQFDGKSYLILEEKHLGELDITSPGVTVIAWIKWTGEQTGFVAGPWNEYEDGGKRQYGLFVSLPYYNGRNQVCGHISKTGKATPPFPYSIDYSASKQAVPKDEWACIGFTYDGMYIKSYLNGIFEPRDEELINHTKGFEGYPDGLKQSKNPYYFPDGIGSNGSDFTVGSVFVHGNMGNFYKGLIGGIAVFARSLTDKEMKEINYLIQSQTSNKNTNPPPEDDECDNELLYNGIILPNVWPPKTGNPFSNEPMDVPYLDNPPHVIPIDIGRQLFVDDFLIEQTNLQRVFHQATKYEENPIITQAAFRQGGVFYDFVNRQFVAAYRKESENGNENPLTFAVSKNLTDWHMELTGQKPVAPINAFWLQYDSLSRRNDWYIMGIDRIEPKPIDDPDVPFINALWENTIHKSTNGKSWPSDVPLGKSNDYSSFFYNPFRKIWVMSIKHNVPRIEKKLYRSRYYAERNTLEESGDFNDAVFWVNADKLDQSHPEIGNEAQLYSLHGVAYESLILGAFQIHLGPSNEIAKKRKVPKYNEMKLGFSRDGFHWYRPDRNSFIKGTYREGDWDRAFINIPQGICLIMGDKLWFPYCGYSGIAPDGTHGMYEGGSIGMATLRRDGFASMETGKQPGTLLTRPVTFSGKFLFVNTDCPEGELLVEILDENGIVMDQFTSKPIHTDKTLYKVVWKSGADLSGLVNKPVRFRFNLTNGKLYSFWVSPDESGASYGYVGAGGPGFDGIIDNKGINAY